MRYLYIDHKNIDTVIFDFDGTLAELNIDFDFMRQSIDDLLSLYGVDPSILKNGYILERMHEAEVLLKDLAIDKAKSFLSEAYAIIERIEVDAAVHGRLFDQTRELLAVLKRNDISTGIITRNCSRAVYSVFPDILTYCPVVICREDVNKVKPDPGHIIFALNRLCSSSHKAIMIGDHPIDIQTGRNAGTMTAGVTTGHYEKEDFITAGADIVLRHASDILANLITTC